MSICLRSHPILLDIDLMHSKGVVAMLQPLKQSGVMPVPPHLRCLRPSRITARQTGRLWAVAAKMGDLKRGGREKGVIDLY